MEIWSTPHGFVKAAVANNASSTPAGTGSEVTFTAGGKYRYAGTINAQNQVERVRTWIDNNVLGDTPVETVFSDYRDFGGTTFPGRIQRAQGGHPVLDLNVSAVTANPAVDLPVPDAVRRFTPPPVRAESEVLAPGVFYVAGGSHHSVAINQADHIVVVEGPQHEERSLAVIAKVKELIPGKPIRYLINSHAHFDHSGGLRTYVDEGATIVTHALNRPFYETAWAAPRTLVPDRLAGSKRAATFQTFTDKAVLTDGKRSIEVHAIAGNGHNDAFAMVYLPAEKILIRGRRLLAAGGQRPAAGRGQSVFGQPPRQYRQVEAGRRAAGADPRPGGAAGRPQELHRGGRDGHPIGPRRRHAARRLQGIRRRRSQPRGRRRCPIPRASGP